MNALLLIALLATAEQSHKSGCGYPCNHYVHVAEGAALSAAISHYYGESTAWKVGLGFAVGTEIAGKVLHGKKISAADVATRSIGTGAGIWLHRQF